MLLIVASVVEADDVSARDDLAQPSVDCVSYLDKVLVEEDEVFAEEAGGAGVADEFHHDAAADVAVLVDVDGALFVRDDELGFAEAEHA